MRIAVQRVLRQAHVVYQRRGALPAFRLRADAIDGQRLGDDGRDRHARIERAERILEHDLDRVLRDATGRTVERVSAKPHLPLRRLAQSGYDMAESALAAAALAHQADGLALRYRQADLLHRMQHAAPAEQPAALIEVHAHPIQFDQRRHQPGSIQATK